MCCSSCNPFSSLTNTISIFTVNNGMTIDTVVQKIHTIYTPPQKRKKKRKRKNKDTHTNILFCMSSSVSPCTREQKNGNPSSDRAAPNSIMLNTIQKQRFQVCVFNRYTCLFSCVGFSVWGVFTLKPSNDKQHSMQPPVLHPATERFITCAMTTPKIPNR